MIKVQGNKFLVTGGAGFIGSHIIEELIRQGKEVVCIDDLSNGKVENVSVPVRTIELAMCPVTDLCRLLEGVDVIFHNAASKCTVCRLDPLVDLMTNAWGSFNVFMAASNFPNIKVVHASTGSVYGECGTQHEGQQYAPRSFYGVSKLAGEQYLRCFPGLKWAALRYFHVYGPRQDSSDKGGVIPIFINKMLQNKPVTVYGDGEQTRSFTYVKDVVNANFLAANSIEESFYNVASGVKITLNSLIDVLQSILDVDAMVHYQPEREGDIKNFNVDNGKITALGLEFTDFAEGIRETIKYYDS
ncbi:MAG: NAD-dependent epimerase/dehydratase family protein [Deltaproteobacteria bacterium]|nr:NAD-dependent epimerase/dehydratase family protein [Deltaproteobacteria bacterium]